MCWQTRQQSFTGAIQGRQPLWHEQRYKLLYTFRSQLSDDNSYNCVYQKQDSEGNSRWLSGQGEPNFIKRDPASSRLIGCEHDAAKANVFAAWPEASFL